MAPSVPFYVRLPHRYVATARIAPLVKQWRDEGGMLEWLPDNDKRLVFGMLNERESVSIDAADRILCAIGLSHYWHLPPEDGGLSDVYFHPSVVDAAVAA